MEIKNYQNNTDHKDKFDLINEFYRYLSFWQWFAVSVLIFVSSSYIYLRYAEYKYESSMKIEIVDKAQDSEMALPTAMTIFNRSMINLENEIGVLTSYFIHDQTVSILNSNVKYFTVGNIKTTENHPSEWFEGSNLLFKIDTDDIAELSSYEIETNASGLVINHFDKNNDLVKTYSFNNLSSYNTYNDLPFDISIDENFNNNGDSYLIKLYPREDIVNEFISNTNISESGKQSDQLTITILHPNVKIGNSYLNTLAEVFDKDGITDRQLVYKRTMDFVDSRFQFLSEDLSLIEVRKQEFKEFNNLTDIKSDATVNVEQKLSYDSELFKAKSQYDLTSLLKESFSENKFELMPINIGIENENINQLIAEYNLSVNQRNLYLTSAGPNNYLLKNTESNLTNAAKNILFSIENYQKSLDVKIKSLESKEKEFENVYKNIPENEKILRSIERELEVKESLFLLLLQKREEAAINYAVVKPSIKIIDYSRSSQSPVSPKRNNIILGSIIAGLALPFIFLFIRFTIDNKIHTREQLNQLLNKNITILGEIPFINNSDELYKIVVHNSRKILAESIRMIIANLDYVTSTNSMDKKENKVILVTSSVKGEGKTLVSANVSSVLSSKYKKVLLIGADLRNPQLHKFLGLNKSVKGLSNILHKNDNDNFKNYIVEHNNNLDILLSGTIPPNPNQMLSSKKFSSLIERLKSVYDKIVIDSAPCILVSDTFEISKSVDYTLYVTRANFSNFKTVDFINDCEMNSRLPNISMIFNSVGNSVAYGYRYGYQYGYKYGYNYGYNYGYGKNDEEK